MKKVGTITVEIYQLESGGFQSRHDIGGLNEPFAAHVLLDVARDIYNLKLRELTHQLEHHSHEENNHDDV